MSFLGISGLVNFISCAIFEVLIIFINPKSKLNRSYLFFNACLGLYSFGYFLWQLSQNVDEAFIWFKVLTIGFILINVSLLHFIFYLVNIIERKKIELAIYYIINIIFIFLTANSNLYNKVEPRFDLGYWPVTTFLFKIYLIFWFYQCFYIFILLIRGIKSSIGIKQEQIKYITIALLIGFGGGATNWLMWFNIYFPPYANIFITIYTILVAYAIIKHQLLDIKIVITRAGIFLCIYIIMLGFPLWIGFHTDFKIYSFITLFVMATIGPFLYRFFQKKADDILLSDQRRYQNFLYWSANSIVKLHDLDKLLETIVKIIVGAVKIEYAVLFINDKENSVYLMKAGKGSHAFINKHPYYREFAIPDNDPVIKQIKGNDKPFIKDEVNNLLGLASEKSIQLIIPLYFDNKLTGFIFLGEKLNKSFYTREDYKVFETLAGQAALAIENCLFIENNKKIQERLFCIEKFSLLGGMAEGLAHQIRNRLNHFSIASSTVQIEIERFSDDNKNIIAKIPELKTFLSDLSKINDSVFKNVQSTNAVVNNFIDYALIERDENSFSQFSLKKAIDIAFKLVQIKHDNIKDIALVIEVEEKKTIYGIMSQIQEMIYNLLDNSFEAIEEKARYRLTEEEKNAYKPVIIFRLKETEDAYIIEAFDNGVGIQEENKSKIFAPYFTTKSSFKPKPNPGIGMYIMNRIVEEVHNGKIRFESEDMKGTTFYITLPKNKKQY